MNCNECGAPVRDLANFCPACGAQIPWTAAAGEEEFFENCPGCGAKVKTGARFCGKCGMDLEAAAYEDDGTDTKEQPDRHRREAALRAAKKIARKIFEKQVEASDTPGEMTIELGDGAGDEIRSAMQSLVR